jgi:hypothetical protein
MFYAETNIAYAFVTYIAYASKIIWSRIYYFFSFFLFFFFLGVITFSPYELPTFAQSPHKLPTRPK